VTSASIRQDDDVEGLDPTSGDGVEPLYTIKELMAWLSISDFTLRAWRKAEDPIPAIVVGGIVRFRPSQVNAWLDRRNEAA
jgi:hypothetical protein